MMYIIGTKTHILLFVEASQPKKKKQKKNPVLHKFGAFFTEICIENFFFFVRGNE